MDIWGEETLFLSSTDTTIGFLSSSKRRLDLAKRRENKEYIQALSSLSLLKFRVPKEHRNLVRRAKRVSFILPNSYSFRVVRERNHLLLLKRFGKLYSTSANLTGESYNYNYAYSQADIIIYPLRENAPASSIIQLSKSRFKKRVR